MSYSYRVSDTATTNMVFYLPAGTDWGKRETIDLAPNLFMTDPVEPPKKKIMSKWIKKQVKRRGWK